jgi:hypothetical protein
LSVQPSRQTTKNQKFRGDADHRQAQRWANRVVCYLSINVLSAGN